MKNNQYVVLIIDDDPGYPIALYKEAIKIPLKASEFKGKYFREPYIHFFPELIEVETAWYDKYKYDEISDFTLKNYPRINDVDLILLDWDFNQVKKINSRFGDGDHVLKQIQQLNDFRITEKKPTRPVIILSGKYDDLIKLSSMPFDYVPKGDIEKIKENAFGLRLRMDRALTLVEKERELFTIQPRKQDQTSFSEIPLTVAREKCKMPSINDIAQIADYNFHNAPKPMVFSIFLHGATGTGKSKWVYQFIEKTKTCFRSNVAKQDVNCAQFGPYLIDSELFGICEGTATDVKENPGRISKLSDGGILFLDEIEEMDSSKQAKLLKFMERGTYYRAGGGILHKKNGENYKENDDHTKEQEVKYMILIAAANQDAKVLIENDKLRRDLYHRFDFKFKMPDLTLYTQDQIRKLVDLTIIADINDRYNGREDFSPPKKLASDDEYALIYSRIPIIGLPSKDTLESGGNIRQLQKWLERTFLLTADSEITVQHLEYHFEYTTPIDSESGRQPYRGSSENLSIDPIVDACLSENPGDQKWGQQEFNNKKTAPEQKAAVINIIRAKLIEKGGKGTYEEIGPLLGIKGGNARKICSMHGKKVLTEVLGAK